MFLINLHLDEANLFIYTQQVVLFFNCILQITLTENRSDFEEFFFASRKASWAKFTITKVNGTSGGAWTQEIELYDDKCDHSK